MAEGDTDGVVEAELSAVGGAEGSWECKSWANLESWDGVSVAEIDGGGVKGCIPCDIGSL